MFPVQPKNNLTIFDWIHTYSPILDPSCWKENPMRHLNQKRNPLGTRTAQPCGSNAGNEPMHWGANDLRVLLKDPWVSNTFGSVFCITLDQRLPSTGLMSFPPFFNPKVLVKAHKPEARSDVYKTDQFCTKPFRAAGWDKKIGKHHAMQ